MKDYNNKNSVLIIAAARFEAEATILKLQSIGIVVEFLELGIGALAAVRSIATFDRFNKNQKIFYIGTCGLFGHFTGVELVVPVGVFYSDTAERLGLAYSIKGQYPEFLLNTPPELSELGLRSVDVVSSGAISLEEHLPENLKKTARPLVENLEIYGALPQLISSGLTVYAVLGVTNKIGREAHEEWKAHFRKAAEMTASLIGEMFD